MFPFIFVVETIILVHGACALLEESCIIIV